MDSYAKLHVTRRVRLTRDLTEGGGTGQTEARVAGLEWFGTFVMVKEHHASPFPINADTFNDIRIQVPGGTQRGFAPPPQPASNVFLPWSGRWFERPENSTARMVSPGRGS